MKRMMLTFTLLFMLVPTYSFAKDAAPAVAKDATKAAPASAPAVAPASAPAIANLNINASGTVEVVKDKTKVTVIPDEQKSVVDTATLIKEVVIAFKDGKYWYGISLLLMILTFVIGLVEKKIPPNALPWIAAFIGVATNVVGAVVGGTVWWEAAISGLFQGAAAAGLWSLIGKHVLVSAEVKTKRANARKEAAGKSTSGSIEEK